MASVLSQRRRNVLKCPCRRLGMDSRGQRALSRCREWGGAASTGQVLGQRCSLVPQGQAVPSYNCLQSFEINPWAAKASLLKYDFFFSSQALNFLCHELPLTLFTLYVWYRFTFLLNSHFLFAYIFQDLNQSCCQNSLFVSSTYQHLSLEMFKAPVL